MDLVDFDEARFHEIERELDELTAALGVKDEVAIPIAALHGDNVVDALRADAVVAGRTLLAASRGDRARGRPQPRTTAASRCSG